MEEKTITRKLALNKRVISKLDDIPRIPQPQNVFTAVCTFPECASEPYCRTDNLQSCAPCVPPPRGTGAN